MVEREVKKQHVLSCNVYGVEGLLLEQEVNGVKADAVFVAATGGEEVIVNRKEHFPLHCRQRTNVKNNEFETVEWAYRMHPQAGGHVVEGKAILKVTPFVQQTLRMLSAGVKEKNREKGKHQYGLAVGQAGT